MQCYLPLRLMKSKKRLDLGIRKYGLGQIAPVLPGQNTC